MNFAQLGLAEPLLRAVAAEGYTIATPIQIQTIPKLLTGHDLLGVAQTGTGKTAAFALPILHRLLEQKEAVQPRRRVRALILAPTRELAGQIGESIAVYGRNTGLRHTVIFGGVNQFHQVKALRNGVDIIVATPGRLLDLMQQRMVDLRGVNTLVLDEADRMFDMGFLPDLKRVISALPTDRQTMLFSATMPPPIEQLAHAVLKSPERIFVKPEQATVDLIEQSVYMVSNQAKQGLLEFLIDSGPRSRTIVFTRTKHGADRVVKMLDRTNIESAAIHGNKSQNARQRAMDAFRAGKLMVLVATDLAARGIDVDGVTHVINFDLPTEPETYVHRIGRTGRAGASGRAISFCTRDDRDSLKQIERLIRQRIRVEEVPAGFDLPERPEPRGEAPRGGSGGGERPRHARPQGRPQGATASRAPAGRGQTSRGPAPHGRTDNGSAPKRRKRSRFAGSR